MNSLATKREKSINLKADKEKLEIMADTMGYFDFTTTEAQTVRDVAIQVLRDGAKEIG